VGGGRRGATPARGKALAGFAIRRLLQAVPLLLLVSILVFGMLRLVPGGPMGAYGRSPTMSAQDIARLEERLGLTQPVHVQYLTWLGNVARGDLGYSYDTKRPVTAEIGDRLPATLYLMGVTLSIVLLFAIPIGIICATRQYSWVDNLLSTLTFAGQALPVFWLGLMLILVFYGWARNPWTGDPLLPARGIATLGEPFSVGDRVRHLVLPVTTLGLGWVSWYSRYLRSSMLDVLHQGYVRTARSKGLPEPVVVGRHALKNAAIPLITVVALDLAALVTGAVFVEIIFSWPGMGQLFYRAATRRDYPVLMAVTMLGAVMVVVASLLADLLYAWLNPRIRYR
jgi:peptide/nickel transport system permease protein